MISHVTPLRQKMMDLIAFRNLSPNTCDTYIGAVNALAKHYKRSPTLITEQQAKSWVIECQKKHSLAPSSVHVQVAGLRFFYQQVEGKEGFLKDFILPKIRQKIPDLLTSSEVMSIIQCTNNQKHQAW